MGKLANILAVSLIFLMSCGPSQEELDAYEKAKTDSLSVEKMKIETDKQEKIVEEVKTKKYFVANQFDLIAGTVVGWAPTDETIGTWKCSGGEEPNGTIYVHIQDSYGMVTVMPCTYKAWINLHTGDVLR